MISYVYDTAKESPGRYLADLSLAKQLLRTCLEGVGARIVIDGLDECRVPEQREIVSWVRELVENPAPKAVPSRCVFLSQHDNVTHSLLAKFPTVQITHYDNYEDILTYCIDWSNKIKLRFSLSDSKASEIAAKTSESAKGRLGSFPLLPLLNVRSLLRETP
jgi:hypothetical protein